GGPRHHHRRQRRADRVLLPAATLDALRQAAAANAPQWQAFKARLDGQLNQVVDGAYQGGQLPWIADYALGYQVLRQAHPATASRYADKALAVLRSALYDSQAFDTTVAWMYLGRGDGSTTQFTIPNADYKPSTLQVRLSKVGVVKVTKGAANGQD